MLGMMNCPSDNVEFYSAAPSVRRSIEEHNCSDENMRKLSGSLTDSINSLVKLRKTSEACEKGREDFATSESDVVRVFSEAREKPHITYTLDGRKLVDGKEMTANINTTQDPVQMWDQLILRKVVTSKLDERKNFN